MSGKNKKKCKKLKNDTNDDLVDNTTVNDETQNKSELSIDDDVAVHVTIDDAAVHVTIDDAAVKNDAPKYERTQVDELEVTPTKKKNETRKRI